MNKLKGKNILYNECNYRIVEVNVEKDENGMNVSVLKLLDLESEIVGKMSKKGKLKDSIEYFNSLVIEE